MVSEDHFVGLVMIVLDVFEKYQNTEGMFKKEYTISARCDLLQKLITKVQKDNSEISALISRIIGVLLDNHLLCSTLQNADICSRYEQKNRNVLIILENKFSVRKNLKKYLSTDRRMSMEDMRELVNGAYNYLEQLYGYLDLEQIRKKLRKRYGDKCTIYVYDSVAYIEIITNNPSRCLRPDTGLLKDLVKYSNNVSYLSQVIILVEDPRPECGTSIWQIKNTISLKYKKYTQEILRKNRMYEENPSKYISF